MKFSDGWQISLICYNFYKRNFNDIWEVFQRSALVKPRADRNLDLRIVVESYQQTDSLPTEQTYFNKPV